MSTRNGPAHHPGAHGSLKELEYFELSADIGGITTSYNADGVFHALVLEGKERNLLDYLSQLNGLGVIVLEINRIELGFQAILRGATE